MVTLHVGPGEHVFPAHRNHLAFSSDLFKSALVSEQNSDRPRIIKLSNQSPPIVNAYLRFAYGGGLEPVNIIYRGTPEGSHDRRLMTNIHVVYGGNEMLDLSCEPDFVLDVARAFHTKTERCTKSADLRLHGLRERVYIYWDCQHDRLAMKPGGVVVISEGLELEELRVATEAAAP